MMSIGIGGIAWWGEANHTRDSEQWLTQIEANVVISTVEVGLKRADERDEVRFFFSRFVDIVRPRVKRGLRIRGARCQTLVSYDDTMIRAVADGRR